MVSANTHLFYNARRPVVNGGRNEKTPGILCIVAFWRARRGEQKEPAARREAELPVRGEKGGYYLRSALTMILFVQPLSRNACFMAFVRT